VDSRPAVVEELAEHAARVWLRGLGDEPELILKAVAEVVDSVRTANQ
jgi:hypothetical protein